MNDLITVKISLEDANLVLRALGNLPYVQVHQLVHSLQNQIGPQLVIIDQKNKENQQVQAS